MKKEDKIPEFRFDGYENPWRREKLDRIVDVRSGMDYKHLQSGDIPVYGTGGYMLCFPEALGLCRQTHDRVGQPKPSGRGSSCTLTPVQCSG